jgi:hypothetical protein
MVLARAWGAGVAALARDWRCDVAGGWLAQKGRRACAGFLRGFRLTAFIREAVHFARCLVALGHVRHMFCAM